MAEHQQAAKLAAFDPPVEGARPEGALVRRPRPSPNSWLINVLLVDDDEADSTLALSLLRQHTNVSTAIAIASPEEAVRQLAAGKLKPNLILLDIQMPRMDGFAFIKAIDKIPALRSTPVVILTTSRFERDVQEARRVLASAYIVKPESVEMLRKRLDAAVRQAITGKWS